MNIVLTGFMGTGKTVVGKRLAVLMNKQYIDIDDMIESDSGMRIPEIFKKKGETFFRDLETKAVRCISLLDDFIIITGGGVVLRKENMDELEKNGFIVCLTATVDEIYNRVRNTNYRPLLNVNNPLEEIRNILKKREQFYKRCHLMVDTTKKSVEEVANEIINFYRKKYNEKNIGKIKG